jgi:hypothetical protein
MSTDEARLWHAAEGSVTMCCVLAMADRTTIHPKTLEEESIVVSPENEETRAVNQGLKRGRQEGELEGYYIASLKVGLMNKFMLVSEVCRDAYSLPRIFAFYPWEFKNSNCMKLLDLGWAIAT